MNFQPISDIPIDDQKNTPNAQSIQSPNGATAQGAGVPLSTKTSQSGFTPISDVPLPDNQHPYFQAFKSAVQDMKNIADQVSYGAAGNEIMGEKTPTPSGILQKGANVAGQFLGPSGAGELPLINGVTNSVMKSPIVQRIGSEVATKVLPKAGQAAQALFSWLDHIATSVPEKYINHAMDKMSNGIDILSGKFTPYEYAQTGKQINSAIDSLIAQHADPKVFEKIGNQAQDGVNYLLKQTGQAVKAANAPIAESEKPFDPKMFVDKINAEMAKKTNDGVPMYTPNDEAHINALKDLFVQGIKNDETPSKFVDANGIPLSIKKASVGPQESRLLSIKKRAETMANYNNQTVNPPSSVGNDIIKKIPQMINDYLNPINSGRAEANAASHEAQSFRDELKNELADKKAYKTILNYDSLPPYTQSLLAKVDSQLPDNMKFIPNLRTAVDNANTANSFKPLKTLANKVENMDKISPMDEASLQALEDALPDGKKFMDQLNTTLARGYMSKLLPRSKTIGDNTANAIRLASSAVHPIALPFFSPLVTRGVIRSIPGAKMAAQKAIQGITTNASAPVSADITRMLMDATNQATGGQPNQ